MRTTNFSSILFNALQYSGNDRNNISDETFQQFRDFASTSLREAWETVQWSDICRVVDVTATLDAVTGINYFIPVAEASEILGVFSRNPQSSTKAVELEYSIYETGSEKRIIINPNIATCSYLYRIQCPVLNGDIYSPSTTYYSGVQIYFDSGSGTGTYTPVAGKPHSGNFYTCAVTNTTAGQNPNNTPSAWTKIEIPYIFSSFCSWNSCAMWYASEGMMQEAGVIDSKAKLILEQEYDKFLHQQGQFGRINMYKTY
jgi:hypothetical protein